VAAWYEHFQELYDAVSTSAADSAFEDVAARFREASAAAIPGRNPDGDSWEPRTQCTWDAGGWFSLLSLARRLGGPVHDDILEACSWFSAGHWPNGLDVSTESRLMVL